MDKMPKDMSLEELEALPIRVLLSMDMEELHNENWEKRDFIDSDGKKWYIGKDKDGWFKATGMAIPGM